MAEQPIIHGFSPAERAAIIAARDHANLGTPSLVRAAFLLAPITVGNITLRPVTLSDWLALEELQHPMIVPGGRSGLADHARLMFVLAHAPRVVREALADRPSFAKQVAGFVESIPEPASIPLIIAVALQQLRDVTSTVTGRARQRLEPFAHLPEKNAGLGWLLTLAGALYRDYGWSETFVIDELPLARMFMYYAELKAARGQEPTGPSYVDHDIFAALKEARQPMSERPGVN